MAWVLLTVTGALAVLVGVLLLRLRRLERRVAALSASSDPHSMFSTVDNVQIGSLDGEEPVTEYVITRIGEPEPEPEPVPLAAPDPPIPSPRREPEPAPDSPVVAAPSALAPPGTIPT